ncbi:hypothetical protein M378DRAFT_170441, partial [Amanita muscaria Koide BX008]
TSIQQAQQRIQSELKPRHGLHEVRKRMCGSRGRKRVHRVNRWATEALTESDRVGVVDVDVEQPGFNVVKPVHTPAATADVPPIPFVPLVFILVIPIAVAAPPAAAPAPGLDDDAAEVEPDPELAFGSWDPTTGEG